MPAAPGKATQGIMLPMEYLSQMLAKPVLDESGERIATVTEVIISPHEPLPLVVALQVKTEDGALFLPYSALEMAPDHKAYSLTRPLSDIRPYMPQPHDFSLVRDVLDKQIVDVHDYRVVRVNDIRLAPTRQGKELVLVGVDTGLRGVMRRLGLEHTIDSISKALHLGAAPAQFIPWNDVESLPTHNAGEPIKLKISHEKLALLHPADIGNILNQLDPVDRNELLETLDVETAADALAEAEDNVQVSALKTLNEERAADLLEEMPVDEAADVLGDLDKARREELLEHMEADEREDVRELLSYKDETAGGMMTNAFVSLTQDLTAAETIDYLRSLSPDAETIYYLYVTDTDEHLTGVISLRDLIVASPATHISEFMITKVRSVQVGASLEEVAHQFERYKLLALPVIDADHHLLGIITVDDTLEQLLPDDWRRRPVRRPSPDDPE